MSLLKHLVLAMVGMALMAASVAAQETETKVIDEVVAQVNDGVITLSSVTREIKEAVDSKVQEGMKRVDAQRLVDEKRGELIANLINEELIIQKAKELGLETPFTRRCESKVLTQPRSANYGANRRRGTEFFSGRFNLSFTGSPAARK